MSIWFSQKGWVRVGGKRAFYQCIECLQQVKVDVEKINVVHVSGSSATGPILFPKAGSLSIVK